MEYQESLKERIKELECLYDISTLISQSSETRPTLASICKRLEQAFQYPEFAQARIALHGEEYTSKANEESDIMIKQDILFQSEIIGNICVSYRSSKGRAVSFLIEEKKLLNKVAQEIAFLYERERRDKDEAILNTIVRRQERLTILGEMTAGVAHELNTPLGNIVGFSEFIIESTEENSTKKDAQKIKQSALHAREIVKKLMLFSCDIPQKLSSTALADVLKEAIDLLGPLLRQHEISIEFSNSVSDARALIDRIQFTQVVFNLLSNAIQASEPGSVIDMSLSEKNGYVTIMIQDFGCGIPLAIQDKIFDPFFTYNKKGSGNGLGLSVVHGIIKQHKGRIQFSSQEGEGTTFVLSIPKLS